MPDAHWGLGSTVGSVIPTDDVVMPAAVGVDIGCGMAAVRTHLTRADVERTGSLTPLRTAIEREIPVFMGQYRMVLSRGAERRVAELEERAAREDVTPDAYAGNWRLQLGTLGSGNHFIEVCLDETDRVWVFLHSGSRGIGNRIAKKHVAIAQRLCQMWHVPLPHRDLAYLPEGTDEFWAYLRDLRWA
jgi:tRNA-splicing ligase RtcB